MNDQSVRYEVSVGHGRFGTAVDNLSLTKDELRELVTVAEPGVKDGSWIIPGRMDGPRKDANLRSISVIFHDLDGGDEAVREAIERIKAGKHEAWVVPTHSHTPEKPKYRIIRPLAEPIEVRSCDRQAKADWKSIKQADERRLGIDGLCDNSTYDFQQFYYLPRYYPARWPDGYGQETHIVDGKPVFPSIEVVGRDGTEPDESGWENPFEMWKPGEREESKLRRLATLYQEAIRSVDSILVEYGYEEESPGKYSPPHSPGTGGVNVVTGDDGHTRVFSHHDRDPLRSENGMDILDVMQALGVSEEPSVTAAKALVESSAGRAALMRAPEAFQAWVHNKAGGVVQPAPEEEIADIAARIKALALPVCSEVGAVEPPKMTFLWDDIIPAGDVGLLTAPGGTGKSYFALALGLHVAAGLAFHDTETVKGKVAYISSEDRADEVTRRLHRQVKRMPPECLPDLDANFIAIPIRGTPYKFAERTAKQLVVETKAARAFGKLLAGYGLVIIDTMSRAHTGCEENSNSEMGAVHGIFEQLSADTGATVLILHHSGKHGVGAMSRGASVLEDNSRVVVSLRRLESSECPPDDPKATYVEISAPKANYSARTERMYGKIDRFGYWVTDLDSQDIEILRESAAEAAELKPLKAALQFWPKDQRELSTTDLGDLLGLPRNRRRAAIDLLVETGRIVKRVEGPTKWYSLVE